MSEEELRQFIIKEIKSYERTIVKVDKIGKHRALLKVSNNILNKFIKSFEITGIIN